MNYAGRPFTTAVARLRDQRATYKDLASRCHGARSDAWFWNLLNSEDPWIVLPPGRDQLPGMSSLLGVSTKVLKAWIATEWYEAHDGEQSPDTIVLAAAIASLDDDNRTVLAALAHRMWTTQLRSDLCDVTEVLARLTQNDNAA